jgi:hypothetical protein
MACNTERENFKEPHESGCADANVAEDHPADVHFTHRRYVRVLLSVDSEESDVWYEEQWPEMYMEIHRRFHSFPPIYSDYFVEVIYKGQRKAVAWSGVEFIPSLVTEH